MTETNVFPLAQPGTFADSLTDVLREGARALLAHAVEAEVADFLARHADFTTRMAVGGSCGTDTCPSVRS